MAHTLYEGSKLSRNPLAAGVLRAIATTDELLAVTPMVVKPGESFMYNREKALPSVEFVAPDHVSIAESSATFDRVIVPKRLIVSDVDTYLFTEEEQGETNSQKPVQLMKKLKALGRKLGDKLINGGYATSVSLSAAITGTASFVAGPNQDSDRHGPGSLFFDVAPTPSLSYRAPGDRAYGTPVDVSSNGTYVLRSDNPNRTLTVTVTSASLPVADAEVLVRIASTTNEYDGLKKLCPTSQTVASTGANGDALSFAVMDELIDEKIKVRERLFFVMNGKLKRKYFALVRALGGTDPTHVTVPGITSPVPTYRGIPILQNDWITSDEVKGGGSTLSSVYLVSASFDEGLYFGVSGVGGAAMADLDPRGVRLMGLRVREIGELEDKEADRMRVSWRGASALGSELGVARASEIVTA